MEDWRQRTDVMTKRSLDKRAVDSTPMRVCIYVRGRESMRMRVFVFGCARCHIERCPMFSFMPPLVLQRHRDKGRSL